MNVIAHLSLRPRPGRAKHPLGMNAFAIQLIIEDKKQSGLFLHGNRGQENDIGDVSL